MGVGIVKGIRFLETEANVFLRIVKEMPLPTSYGLADHYNVEVPARTRSYELPTFLFENLDSKARNEIIEDFRDAGKPICHFFGFDKNAPTLNKLTEKSHALLHKEREEVFPGVPYFNESGVHHLTNSFRVRFHYYERGFPVFDPEMQKMKQYYPISTGVVIFRPNRRLVEVRAKNRSVSKHSAISSSVILGLEDPHPMNLNKEEYIRRFLQWINSLNNAKFEFDVRRILSTISLSARGRMDLRVTDDFKKYLKEGKLRGGHATFATEEGHQIRFRIFFRDCHATFTKFCSEISIGIVVDALERIFEGLRIESPDKLIEDWF